MNSKKSHSQQLKMIARLIRDGETSQARKALTAYLKSNPQSDRAWLLLSFVLPDREKRIYALERAVKINPANEEAQMRLEKLKPLPKEKPFDLEEEGVKDLVERPQVEEQKPAFPPEAPKQIPRREDAAYSLIHRLRFRFLAFWRRFKMNWGYFSQSRLAILGLVLIVIFALMAVAHPILLETVLPRKIYDPVTGFDINASPHPSPPSSEHLLGTDSLGRDVLSMLLAATTPTFLIGFSAAMTTAVIGTFLSMIAAYFRGALDTLITNLADVFLLLPAPVIMVIIGARFRDLGPVQLGVLYGIVTGAGGTTLVMRTQAIQIVSKPFMQASRIAGGGAWHMIGRHLLPSILPLAALQMMVAVTGVVVADGFISFFGVTRTVSNWGTIIYDAFVYKGISGGTGEMWHMLVPASLCFTLFALGFYLISRGLHRVASPELRDDR